MGKRIKPKSIQGKIIFNIVVAILTLLAHISLVLLFILSFRYYELELNIFLGMIGVFVCILIITDLLFFVGFNYKIQPIRIINCVLASILLIVGCVGSIYVMRINGSINKVIENTGTDQYEVIGGVMSYYKNSSSGKSYSSIDDLKKTSSVKVGMLYDSGVGTGTIAEEIFKDESIAVDISKFNTTDDLLSALVGKDEDNVDVAVFPSSYRQRLETDENVDYSQYLDNIVDFYSFEEKVKTGENENANRDLSGEPFNILLIGFAPENEAMTYGLADTIIVATVNPKTLTVSMTSIARDSYVPISCYGGNRDKINASRGTSRTCLMETVSDLLDIDIDYYMEVNFKGVVQIVDAVGGIPINSPVEFVGQTASGIRGEMTVWVPAGEYWANGEQALAFARERHHMPAGDFDRQKHQQEVIAAVAQRLIEIKDVNKALDVLEAAGDNISTNLSLKQLTSVFNYIVNTKNVAGISTFNMLDIQNMRVTGYSSWTYNYSMNLPLWIYKLYNGSIQEAKDRINDVLNNYVEYHPDYFFKFFVEYPYNRGQLYSEYFNEAQEHEDMPAHYPLLTNMSYEDALAWASENGVSLNVTFINQGDAGYDSSLEGRVISQEPRQGALIADNPVGYITVMGNGNATYIVDNCNDENSCKVFANSKGIKVVIDYKYFIDNSHVEGTFAGSNYVNGDEIKKSDTLIIYLWKKAEQVVVPAITSGMTLEQYEQALTAAGFVCTKVGVSDGATEANNGSIISVSNAAGTLTPGTSKASKGETITVRYYLYDSSLPACDINAHRQPDNSCACNEGYEGDGTTTCTPITPPDNPPEEQDPVTPPVNPQEENPPVNPEPESNPE